MLFYNGHFYIIRANGALEQGLSWKTSYMMHTIFLIFDTNSKDRVISDTFSRFQILSLESQKALIFEKK
jgi:hypothetical protein